MDSYTVYTVHCTVYTVHRLILCVSFPKSDADIVLYSGSSGIVCRRRGPQSTWRPNFAALQKA